MKIIKPKKSLSLDDIKEIWKYKELLYFFTWRNLKVRYKQTAIGIVWVIFQPVITMVVFSIFFGKFVGVPSDGIPYPIFVYTGLLLWQFFSASLSDASNSLVAHQMMITKIYFPKLIIPISAVLTRIIDFLVASLILVALMFYYNHVPSLTGILIMPLLLIITFMASLGLGSLFSAINVKYRDVGYILPYFIQILLFLTPVIYPVSVAGKYAWILALNPLTGIIQTARATLLGSGIIDWQLLSISIIISVLMLIIGVLYFRKNEKDFADII